MQNFHKKYDYNILVNSKISDSNYINDNKLNENSVLAITPPISLNWKIHNWHAYMLFFFDAYIKSLVSKWFNISQFVFFDNWWIKTYSKTCLEKENKFSSEELPLLKINNKINELNNNSLSEIFLQLDKLWFSNFSKKNIYNKSPLYTRYLRNCFLELYEKWFISKKWEVVNWSVKSNSVLSNSELTYKSENEKIYNIRYFIEWKWDSIIIQTNRPETIFSDVAILVNPKDRRYKKYIWKNVLIPIINKPIPIFADDIVDTLDWTWNLRLNPAHFHVPNNLLEKHKLSFSWYSVNKDWYFTELSWEFSWQKMLDIFWNFIRTLDEIWNLESISDKVDFVPYWTVFWDKILNLYSEEWFVDLSYGKDLYLEDNWNLDISIVWNVDKNDFLNSDYNYCISRNVPSWLKMPVWKSVEWEDYLFNEDNVIIENWKNKVLSMIIFNLIADWLLKNDFNIESLINVLFENSFDSSKKRFIELYLDIYKLERPDLIDECKQIDKILSEYDKNWIEIAWDLFFSYLDNSSNIIQVWDLYRFVFNCNNSKSNNLIREEIYFDNWFINSIILLFSKKYFNINNYVLYTWDDTINKWISRIIWVSNILLTEKVSMNVISNNLLYDKNWNKVSRSLYNWINPIDYVNKFWLDNFRLATLSTNNKSLNFINDDRSYYYDRFLNKFWNVARFINVNIIWLNNVTIDNDLLISDIISNKDKLSDFDIWILNRFIDYIKNYNECFATLSLSDNLDDLINLLWNDFSDTYLELIKFNWSEYTNKVLILLLWFSIKLLNPYAPVVSEKLWELFSFDWSIYELKSLIDFDIWILNSKVSVLMDIISSILKLRKKLWIKSHEWIDIFINWSSVINDYILDNKEILSNITWARKIDFINSNCFPEWFTINSIWEVNLWIKLVKELSNKDKLIYLEKKLEDKNQLLQSLRNLITNQWFIDSSSEATVLEKTKQIKEIKLEIEEINLEINKIRMKI